MSFWDTLGKIAQGSPTLLSFDLARAAMGDQESKNMVDRFLPEAFSLNPYQGSLTTLNPDGTVQSKTDPGPQYSLGNTLNNIPGYKQVMPVLSYVPHKFDQAIATTTMAAGPLDWSQAWDATTEKGIDVNGVHISNVSSGEVAYEQLHHPLAPLGIGQQPLLGRSAADTKQFMQEARGTWSGRVLSGALTTATDWYADPTLGVGKISKAARLGSTLTEGARTEQAVEHARSIATGDNQVDKGIGRVFSRPGSEEGLFSANAREAGNRVYKMAAATLNGANPQLLERVVARTPDAAPMRVLWQMADAIKDPEKQLLAKIDIIGAAANSDTSMARLIDQAPDIAAAQMRLSSAPAGRVAADALADIFRQTALKPGTKGNAFLNAAQSHATPQVKAELEAYGNHLDRIHRQLQGVDAIGEATPLEGAGVTALDRAKAWARGKVEHEMYFSNGPASSTVRVLHWASSQRFRGSIDVENSVRGNQELMDHTLRSRLFNGAERQYYSQRFLAAETKEGRRRIVDEVHDAMYHKVAAKFPEMSEDQLRQLVADRNEVSAAGRKYAAAQTEEAAAQGKEYVTLLDAQGDKNYTTVNRALYSSHIANNASLPDPNEIEDVIRRTLTEPTITDRVSDAAGFVHSAADKFNSAWRLAVLARPGLLVRTQIDSQGRAIAVMGGTTVMANALRGLGHGFNKRLTHDEEVQLGGVVDDLLKADRQSAEAEHLRYLAKRNARIRQQRQAVGMGDIPEPNTLETQNAILRGEIDPKDLSAPLRVDHIANLTPEQLTARADLLDKSSQSLRDRKYWTKRHRLGTQQQTVNVGGHQVTLDPAYVGTQGYNDIRARLYTGNAVPSEALTMARHRNISDLRNDAIADKQSQLYEDANDYRTFDPDHHFWSAAWIRNTDKMRNSYVGRYILEHGDASLRDIVTDLRNDPKAHAEHREVAGDNPEFDPWLARAIYTVSTVAPTAAVRKALLEHGHMQPADVDELFAKGGVAEADKPARMYIEGPRITRTFPGEKGNFLAEQARKFVHAMGDKPDLALARHPLYVNQYRKHSVSQMRTWFDEHPGVEELPDSVRAHIQNVARHRAIKDVHQVMYDTARHTGAHATLRNVSPFLGAWEDALTSWSRLFYDDFGRAGAFNKLWNVPNNAGLVVDENGNPVRAGQQANQSFMVVPMSWDNNFNTSRKFKIRKDSLNSIFQGAQWYTPGTGPAVQFPLSYLAAHIFPQIGDSNNPLVKSVLPFGTPKDKGLGSDLTNAVEPSWVRALRDAFDPNSQNNARAYMMDYNSQIINAQKKGLPLPSKAALDAHASAAARNAGLFRMAALFGLGVSGDQQNVADFYKQQYDLMYQQADELAKRGLTPSDAFVLAHPEAAGLNWSLTTSDTGVSATLKALSAEKRYAKEIDLNPKYGWFYTGVDNITGDDNPYSQSAYNAQASRTVAGESHTERHLKSRQEIAASTLAEQGWRQYNILTTSINNELARRGLNSITQKGASDLQTIKQQFVSDLRKENPDWSAALDASNATDAVGNFINGIAVPAMKDPKLEKRPDIIVMSQYLAVRQMALDGLAGKHITTLGAQQAYQARQTLYQLGEALSATNLGFQQMWVRVLSHEVDPTDLEKAKAALQQKQQQELNQ